jgi:hypothetical protein
VGAAAAEGEAAPATPFAGHFADPNHPGCPRSISTNATAAAVSGEDEDGRPWTVRASIASNTSGLATILVDFSPKGGPRALEGTWTGASIAWADGNAWQLLTHTTATHCAEYQAPPAVYRSGLRLGLLTLHPSPFTLRPSPFTLTLTLALTLT